MKEQKEIVFEKSHVLFRHLLFIAKAQSSPGNKTAGLVIENEGSRQVIAATDGRRLHFCKIAAADVFPCGRYVYAKEKDCIVLSPYEAADVFPNWRSVVPADTVKLFSSFVSKKDLHEFLWPLYSMGVSVNVSYIADLAGYSWDVFQHTSGKGGVLVCKDSLYDLTAVIMPTYGESYRHPLDVPVEKAEGVEA